MIPPLPSGKSLEKWQNKNKNLLHYLVFCALIFIILLGIAMLIRGVVIEGFLVYVDGYLLIIVGIVTFVFLVLAKFGIWNVNKRLKN